MTKGLAANEEQEALLFDGWGFVPLEKRKDAGKQSKQMPPTTQTKP